MKLIGILSFGCVLLPGIFANCCNGEDAVKKADSHFSTKLVADASCFVHARHFLDGPEFVSGPYVKGSEIDLPVGTEWTIWPAIECSKEEVTSFLKGAKRQSVLGIGIEGGLHFDTDMFELLSSLSELKFLSFVECPRLTDVTLNIISKLPALELLSIWDCPISDEGLSVVATMKRLKSVQLPKQIGLSGITKLKSLPMLTSLYMPPSFRDRFSILKSSHQLSRLGLYDMPGASLEDLNDLNIDYLLLARCSIDDDRLKSISPCLSRLKSLHILGNAGISDFGLATIAALSLKELSLSRMTGLTNEGIRKLLYNTSIERLTLIGQVSLRGDDLKILKNMKSLNKLTLTRQDIYDSDLQFLSECKTIRFLNLSRTRVSSSGIEALLKAHPELTTLVITDRECSLREGERLKSSFPNCNITIDVLR